MPESAMPYLLGAMLMPRLLQQKVEMTNDTKDEREREKRVQNTSAKAMTASLATTHRQRLALLKASTDAFRV
jgi:hypothetical protein